MKKNYFFKMSLLVVAMVGLTLSPVFLHAQQLFSVKQNGFSQEKVAQLTTQIKQSKIAALSLTKNNESKDVYRVTSSVLNPKFIILNEQTGNHVVITPVNESLTELQLAPFFIEELRQGVLGDADYYVVMEATPDYSVKSVVSVSASNGSVFTPRYFYGAKENVKEALPENRQIIGVFKAKPQLISAFPDDLELQRRIAKWEEEMSYYVYMFKLPDGTLCTYDEHYNPDNSSSSTVRGPLQFTLTGKMTPIERTATEYALGLWGKQLEGKVPIDIKVDLVDMGDPYVLGGSYPTQAFQSTQNNLWYPSTLWNQLVGYDATLLMNDIRIEMNSIFDWYLGTDGNPGNKEDYVTTMLHEVNHGLGFSANIHYDTEDPSYNGVFYYIDFIEEIIKDTDYPNAFAYQLFQGTSGPCIADLTPAQRAALVVSGNLYAGRPGSKLLAANGGARVKMYAPNPWQPGSSVSHWDWDVTFTTFMKYQSDGAACHGISKWELGMLEDMGWTLAGGSSNDCMKITFSDDCSKATLNWNTAGKSPAPKGMVNVTLEAHDVWGDGTGYQLLLDQTASTYGSDIYEGFDGCSAPGAYDIFSHKIPTNADPYCKTTNIVMDGKITIQIPAGTYDWCIINPDPDYEYLWIPSINGTYKNYKFEDGKDYHFLMVYNVGGDEAKITITGSGGETTYNVYRDGAKVGSGITGTTYTDQGVTPGAHTWKVTQVSGGSETDICTLSKTCTEGIDELQVTSYELQVYPNPTTGELRVTSYELQVTSMEIFDVYGRAVSTHYSLLTTHCSMDISHLPAGIYFLKIETEKGPVTKKVVKK
ncbi:MAG: DUF2436 domain-containing protein [Bacteroidales bacterium]|nr:DUF2436 domain-containing protein [Bacteroidales bacterium]